MAANVPELIDRKRQGGRLSRPELEQLVLGFVRGEVPDYQVAAWLMAVCWQGMGAEELADLTLVMAESGRTLDLAPVGRTVVDKHSTGGVGDKTSLVVVPLIAACGVPVAKMSGRGLGFSGGTLDKLESLAGFRVDLTPEQFVAQIGAVGAAIAGQSSDLAPADGKLYALRDVTATVASLPLIASSVMSKKLAGGAPIIVLDVKFGRGAFMATEGEARQLARAMMEIGQLAGRTVTAFVTDMDQPLGTMVGNALEVYEAACTLRGDGGGRLVELAVELATEMLVLAEPATDRRTARARIEQATRDGSGYRKLVELVAAQGGDTGPLDDPERLLRARFREAVPAARSGHVVDLDPLAIARAANRLGAGRERKGDPIDHAVGVEILRPPGSRVTAGESLALIHANDEVRLSAAIPLVESAFRIGDTPHDPHLIVRDRLSTRP